MGLFTRSALRTRNVVNPYPSSQRVLRGGGMCVTRLLAASRAHGGVPRGLCTIIKPPCDLAKHNTTLFATYCNHGNTTLPRGRIPSRPLILEAAYPQKMVRHQIRPKQKRYTVLLWTDGLTDVGGGATAATLDRAKRIFSLRHRDWQVKAIQSLLKNHDLFVKAGTGAGKSFMYQSMIASRPNGIVLVIVPLKSIMDDQVHRLLC